MLIDTHCHLNFKDFKDDRDEVLKRSLDNDIWVINVGSQLSTSQRAVEIAEQYDEGVYAIIGLHPIHLYPQHVDEPEQNLDFDARAEKFDKEAYKKLAESKKVVGIGEMGIDYFHMPDGYDEQEVKNYQKQVFLQGLELAQELDLPVTIHTRPSKNSFDAYDDVLEVLEKANYNKCVVHCFGGNIQQAKRFLDMGLLLSFTGIVTFKNAPEIQEIAKITPLEQMMVETDSPYLSPEPNRGKRNEPSYTQFVAEKIAEIKGIEFSKVADATTNTARKFFNI